MEVKKNKLKFWFIFWALGSIIFIPTLLYTVKNYDNCNIKIIMVLYAISFIFFTIAFYFGLRYSFIPRFLKRLKNKHK